MKRALGPRSISILAYNNPSTLCLLPLDHLWLHFEGLEPQSEVRDNAEEGFPTDPFVRGLMFYYGLEFHDLDPESILHISSFIVVCEAFLCITPHFGLWLKTFKVEPKMIKGQ